LTAGIAERHSNSAEDHFIAWRWRGWVERGAFGLLVAALAVAPFPLGANRPWSWSLLCMLVVVCWLLWYASVWAQPNAVARLGRGLIAPLALIAIALVWGVVQFLPVAPASWAHPIWQLAAGILGSPSGGAISLDPWRTETTVMKFATYAMAAWLTRCFAARSERANFLLNAVIAIGAAYAAYALAMQAAGLSQFGLFYGVRAVRADVSAPFVNHNSYATYAGLTTLCAGIRLVERGTATIVSSRGPRQFVLTSIHYLFGRGVLYFAAAALALSSLIATASRAGTFATLVAIVGLLFLAAMVGRRQGRMTRPAGIGAAVLVAIVVLFVINGEALMSRVDDLAVSGVSDNTRLLLWQSALRMIGNAPLFGLGLGTYEIAYPMYSDTMLPFIMDRAHNDYLELAAGWGLPAAICWWVALAWLVMLCARGVLARRRNRVYPMVAVGASLLVGVHALFDFSLQMPAIALTYACLLGLGVAQAFPTRNAT
jgi:O-antigen ligase